MNPICVQEQHLPGDTVLEKWAHARDWGFDGIELSGSAMSSRIACTGAIRALRRDGSQAAAIVTTMPTA